MSSNSVREESKRIVAKGFERLEKEMEEMKNKPPVVIASKNSSNKTEQVTVQPPSVKKEEQKSPVVTQQELADKVKKDLEDFKHQKFLESKKWREFKLLANWKDANFEFFENWGVVTAPLSYMSLDGITPIFSSHKGYFKFPKDEETGKIQDTIPLEEAYRKLIPNGTVVLPHEEAYLRIDKAIQNFNKSDKASIFGKFRLVEDKQDAHKGYTHYWQYLSDRKYDVKKDDTVQFGISFRNGIGTRVSLGGDLYSYRLSCQNGAICRDATIGSFNIPHIISAQRMLEKLTDSLSHTIENYSKLLEYYKAFNATKLSQSIVDKILKKTKIPLKYLPAGTVLDIKTKKDDKELEKAVITLKDKDATLWDLFNGITDPLSRAIETQSAKRRIAYNAFSKRTSRLHKAMMPLVKIAQ